MDIATISALIAAGGVIIGVVLTYLEVRNLVKTRQTDLAFRLYTTVGSKEFQEAETELYSLKFKDYNDFVEKYGSFTSGKPIIAKIGMVVHFFEGLGVLLHSRLVDMDLIDKLFTVKLRWEKVRPIMEGLRKQSGYPNFAEWFEYLYNEMKKREQKLQPLQ